MLEFFNNILFTQTFITHGQCYQMQAGLVGLHLVSDIAIALAYYSIPVMLVYFVHQRRDVPFGGIFSLFSAFIIFCGTTHLLAAWTIWHPAYWLSGFTKAMTAAVSLFTALELGSLIPKAVALPSPAQLEATNRQLENQIAERSQAEEALQKSKEELEIRVAERTAKLKQANEQLKKEIAERKRTEDTLRSLYKVSSARKLSFDQRLQGLLALGRRHLGLDMGAIGRVENNLYEVIAAQVAPKSNFPLAGGNIWNLEQTYCRVTLGAKEPIAFESAGTSHWCTYPAYASSRLEAYIGIPVIVAGKVYGTLSFFSLKVRQNPFTAGDKELLRLVAQWVGAEIERNIALDALRLSEEKYAIAVSGSQVGVWDWNLKTNEMYLTPNLKAMLGYADDEIQNGLDDWDSKVHPDDREAVREAARAHLAGLTPLYEIEHRTLHKDGSIRWFLARATALRDASGKPERLTGTYTNITSRKQAEIERDRFFTISVDLVCILSPNGYFKRVNPAFETTLGYTKEELLATPFIEFIHSEDRAKTLAALQKLIAGDSSKTFENRYRCKDGAYKWLAWTGALLPQDGLIYAAGRDITERKQAESTLRGLTWREREKAEQLEIALQKLQRTQAQLVQTEKMAGLGQMVAGIAHEINNPISFIYGNIKPASEYTQDLLHLLQLYQGHYPQPVAEIQEQLEAIDLDFIQEDFPKLLASMKDGAERIREIVLCLRNFSRLDEAELKPVDIHEGIDNTLLLLQHGLKQKPRCREIQVIKEYGQLPQVQCYPSYLNQVFMNLLGNAIDALEEARREESGLSPMIRIRTEVIEGELPDSYRFMSSPTLQPRRYRTYAPRVVIRIIDNGSGITAEIQPRIFDPFFTTKPPGKGTGLGLSISYQIVVDKHGGQLRFHSALGQGTEFVIELPIVPGKTPHPKTAKEVQTKLI